MTQLGGGLKFVRSDSTYAQGMNAVWHEVREGLVNQAMADYLRFAAKLRTDDIQREMTAAAIAGMSCMQCAVILDVERGRLKDCQPRTQVVD